MTLNFPCSHISIDLCRYHRRSKKKLFFAFFPRGAMRLLFMWQLRCNFCGKPLGLSSKQAESHHFSSCVLENCSNRCLPGMTRRFCHFHRLLCWGKEKLLHNLAWQQQDVLFTFREESITGLGRAWIPCAVLFDSIETIFSSIRKWWQYKIVILMTAVPWKNIETSTEPLYAPTMHRQPTH